jgi:hypothetical protein
MSRSRHERLRADDESCATLRPAGHPVEPGRGVLQGQRDGNGAGVESTAAVAAGAGGTRSRVERATAAVPIVNPAMMSRMALVMAFAPLLEKRRIAAGGTDQGC